MITLTAKERFDDKETKFNYEGEIHVYRDNHFITIAGTSYKRLLGQIVDIKVVDKFFIDTVVSIVGS